MIAFFANLFGYVLNFLYNCVNNNYGIAIILFSVLIKILFLPISVKQQKTMKKSSKIQEEMKQIQFKYKDNPEKLNQEVMSLYKRENMSPFSGCFSSIIQIVLLFSVFYMVRMPLTYMLKIDSNAIKSMESYVQQQGSRKGYEEIAVIDYIQNSESLVSVEKEANSEEQNNEEIKEQNKEDYSKYYEQIKKINMNFLGMDLSKVPSKDIKDVKVLIIPALYVISSFVSMKITTSQQKSKKKKENGEVEEVDAMAQTNKMMLWMMPIMSLSIVTIAPLGLALYWLMNNLLMIVERLILNKVIKDDKEEAKQDA